MIQDENIIYEGVYRAMQKSVQNEVDKALKDDRICCMVQDAIKQYLEPMVVKDMVETYMHESDALRDIMFKLLQQEISKKFGDDNE